jgi:hypothetical protein
MKPRWAPPVTEAPHSTYQWGGVSVGSNVPLPRLASADEPPDVTFIWRSGSPPPLPAAPAYPVRTRDGGVVRITLGGDERLTGYQVSDVGHYAIRALDAVIDFFPAPGANPMQVEHYLVNSALSFYAGLRGVLCLHASAVATNGEAMVFAGPTGVGKSFAALRVVREGGRLITDDTAVLRPRAGRWFVYPGPRTVRLEGLVAGEGWNNRGKTEVLLPSASEPTEVREIALLDSAVSESDQATPAEVYRSLLALQWGWPLGSRQIRKELEEQAWMLARDVTIRQLPASRITKQARGL